MFSIFKEAGIPENNETLKQNRKTFLVPNKMKQLQQNKIEANINTTIEANMNRTELLLHHQLSIKLNIARINLFVYKELD